MRELRALDPLLYPDYDDLLYQNSQFVAHFYTLVTESVCPPFAISLDGLWGTGKTTLMKLLEALLTANFVITTPSLLALGEEGVVSNVLEQLKTIKHQGFTTENDFVAALHNSIGEHGLNQYKSLILAQSRSDPYPVFWFNPWAYQEADSIVLAFLQRFADEMLKRVDKAVRGNLKILGTVGLVGFQVALKALPRAIGDVIDAVADLDKIQAAGERLEKDYETYDDIVTAIQDDFKTLITAVSKKNAGKPVFIFFDDLDRCLPDKAIQLLEAVKNLFVVPDTEVIFICGIDTRIAKQFIKSHYKGIEETFAINYFRKIFNLTVSMPYHPGPTIHALLTDHITRVYGWKDPTAVALAEMVSIWGAQAEMASVRKYLNVIHNFYTFLQFNPIYQFDPHHDLVVFLLIVKEAWQPLYEELVQEAVKARTASLSEVVSKLIKEDDDRETKMLRPEQETFLQDCFINDTDFPFHRMILGDDFLLRYPTLA